MSVANLHTLYAVDVDPITEANAVFIDQLTNYGLDPGIAEILQRSGGEVDPTYVATMGQSPRITFTSTALATILAEMSNKFLLSGIKIDSDATHDGLECFFQKIAEGGARASGSVHIKMTVNEGLLLPRALSAAQEGVASLALEAIIGYDGTNDPIVIANNQALIGAPAVGELFTLGPVKINGTTLSGVIAVTIDPGIAEIVQSGDGQPWPSFIGIIQREPLITITTLEAISLSTFGLAGAAQDASDSLIYLRKMVKGGTRVADATAEHISFSIDEGQIRVRNITAAQGGTVATQVEIRPTWDGANDILIINPATAIT